MKNAYKSELQKGGGSYLDCQDGDSHSCHMDLDM